MLFITCQKTDISFQLCHVSVVRIGMWDLLTVKKVSVGTQGQRPETDQCLSHSWMLCSAHVALVSDLAVMLVDSTCQLSVTALKDGEKDAGTT